jgi:hypothetical protein
LERFSAGLNLDQKLRYLGLSLGTLENRFPRPPATKIFRSVKLIAKKPDRQFSQANYNVKLTNQVNFPAEDFRSLEVTFSPELSRSRMITHESIIIEANFESIVIKRS